MMLPFLSAAVSPIYWKLLLAAGVGLAVYMTYDHMADLSEALAAEKSARAVIENNLEITKQSHTRYRDSVEGKMLEYQEKQEALYERYIEDRKQIDDIRLLLSQTDLSHEAKKSPRRFNRSVNKRFEQLWNRVADTTTYRVPRTGKDKVHTAKTGTSSTETD